MQKNRQKEFWILLTIIIDTMKKLLFYSSVTDKKLFQVQRFYATDITLLSENGYNVILSNNIVDFLFFWQYDLVFIYFYRMGIFAALLAKTFRKKVYFTGGIDDLDKRYAASKRYNIQKLFFKISCFISDSNIIVSKSDMDNIKKIYTRKLPKCLSFSEHTIDVTSFYSVLPKKKQFTTIAWMGGGTSNVLRKGIDKALYVFAYLTRTPEYADYTFVIIGKIGEGSDYLEKLAISLNIRDKLYFTNNIDEKQKIDYLAHSQYYFQLSEYEGFGIAAIEALASYNIVIHSARGGLGDTMRDYAIIFDIENNLQTESEKLYEKLLGFKADDLKQAAEYVKQRFSNERRKNDFQNIIKY